MSESIVCLLDILGYSKLVDKYHPYDDYIKLYEENFNLTLSMMDRLKSNSYSKNPIYNNKKKLIKYIKLLILLTL